MFWLNLIIIMLSNVVSVELGMWLERRKHQLPYKWSCMHEGCIFQISASEWPMLMFLADGHMEAAHDVEQP